MNQITIKRPKVAFILLIIIISISLISCSGEPKYTYEEYKKIKAIGINEDSESMDSTEGKGSDSNEDELQSYFDDLNDYNLYMDEFSSLYDKYIEELLILIDNFDNETENLERKNQHAHSIKELEEKWIADLKEVEVPYFFKVYHDYFIDFLNNDSLFYTYFVEADLEKANNASSDADEFYDKSLIELEAIETDFNGRAERLNIEIPF